MLRGSADLLRSVRHFVPVVETLVSSSPQIWDVDAHAYGEDSCSLILETASRVRAAFPEGASDILVTKIMLGVYGCVPALDTYFRKGFGVSGFNLEALGKIGDFYNNNRQVIDSHCIPTLNFQSGADTEFRYTRAKVIDMIFFVEGGL